MATEHYVDRVENLRLQGPVITLSFVRVQSAEPDQEAPTEEVVKLTMTTQNMVNMTNVFHIIDLEYSSAWLDGK